jgi:hypothetical protein
MCLERAIDENDEAIDLREIFKIISSASLLM